MVYVRLTFHSQVGDTIQGNKKDSKEDNVIPPIFGVDNKLFSTFTKSSEISEREQPQHHVENSL